MKPKYLAGNWKMNTTLAEAQALAKGIRGRLGNCPHRVLIAPPFTSLAAVGEILRGSSIQLGAQNLSNVESGARTGEISVLMLKDLGVTAVIVGHSERRQFCKESDALINQKIKLAILHGLDVILCVGETLEEREKGLASRVVKRQFELALRGVPMDQLSQVTVAYEPIWAIGTGRTAMADQANATHQDIRKTVQDLYSSSIANDLSILYGGSVKPENAADLLHQSDIDGALIGGASLNAEDFTAIAKFGI